MPTGQPDFFEPLAERLIREAMESGQFDQLPGAGRPLSGAGQPDDEMWWLRSWVERNREPDEQTSRTVL